MSGLLNFLSGSFLGNLAGAALILIAGLIFIKIASSIMKRALSRSHLDEQVIQRRKKDQYAEIVVITDEVKEKNLKDALAVAKGMSTVKEISGMIRVA